MRFNEPRRWTATFSAVVLSWVGPSVFASEKYWIARDAQLVVVGTVHQEWAVPWIDGWHISGTIQVNEMLYGPRVGERIQYRFVCGWAALCRLLASTEAGDVLQATRPLVPYLA